MDEEPPGIDHPSQWFMKRPHASVNSPALSQAPAMQDLAEAKEQRLNAFVFDFSSKRSSLVRTLVSTASRQQMNQQSICSSPKKSETSFPHKVRSVQARQLASLLACLTTAWVATAHSFLLLHM
eukprot:1150102-Pelagomonas_calceolata.AAC.1